MPRSKRTPPNCRGRPGRNSLLLQTGVLAAARPGNTRSRRLRQFHHLLCSILLWAVFVFCFFPGTAMGHGHKDSEPDGADQARQWIEQGLDHFKDVKITDQYISFSDGKKINVIVLPRIYWTNYARNMINGRLCNLGSTKHPDEKMVFASRRRVHPPGGQCDTNPPGLSKTRKVNCHASGQPPRRSA